MADTLAPHRQAAAAGPIDGEELARYAAKAAIKLKAIRPVVLDLRGTAGYTDFFVIVSGSSNRHVTAIADAVIDSLAEVGVKPLGIEGYEFGRWVLIDCYSTVIHIFQPEVREFYDLDGFWSQAERLPIDDLVD